MTKPRRTAADGVAIGENLRRKTSANGIAQDATGLWETGESSRANPFCLVALDEIAIEDASLDLIEGLLPAGPALHVAWGPPKSLKSFALMNAYLHIAAGIPYAGRQVLQGAAVYITNEGVRGVNRRLVAMRRHLKIEGLGVPFYLVSAMPNLGTGTDDANSLMAAIAAAVPAGVALRAVAIDTVRRAMPGKDENQAKDMSVFVANCGLIAAKFDCLVSGVHHSPRSDLTHGAGSNALDGAMDCGWAIAREGDSNRATVTVAIMKDGEQGDMWGFTLEPAEIGCSVTIDRPPGSIKPAPTSKGTLPKGAQTALRALHEAIDELGAVAPASNHIPPKTKTVTVDQWRKYAYARGISNSTEDRARQQAFKRGYDHLVGAERVNVWEGKVWPS